MAEIFPFRPWRYARGPLGALLTQPYDKITPAMQERYYAASPHNLVRIILGRTEPGDDAGHSIYTRAADSFREWREQGVLRQEAEPAIYVYSQRFVLPGTGETRERRGFIALARLHDYEEGVIFRHEQTLAQPKADRLQLLRATRAQFGQIFLLYSDAARETDRLLAAQIENRPAEAELADEYGIEHRLWKIADAAAIAGLQNAMRGQQLIIADGHHRYETALAYREERRAAAGGYAPCNAFEKAMMTFVNLDAPGLAILPTHRVVRGLEPERVENLPRDAAEFFTVRKLGAAPEFSPGSQALGAALSELRAAGEQGSAILMATRAGFYLLRLAPAAAATALPGLSPRARRVEVAVLHALVLEKLLALSPDSIARQQNLSYFRDPAEAVAQLAPGGGAQLAFLLNPAPVAQVRELALGGELMPQKSTDFYPKLLSGMAIYALD